MSGFGRQTPVAIGDLAPATLDPSYLLFSGGVWGYAPPPSGGLLDNFGGTVDPTSTDDSAAGYSVGSEWVNIVTGAVFKNVSSTPGTAVWARLDLAGGGGVTGDISFASDFVFNTPSPVVIAALAVGDIVLNTELKIVVPFDDPLATLSVGDVATPGRFMGINENLPGTVSLYTNNANFDTIVAGAARLTINPGASTQGSGQVIVTVRKV